MRIVFTALLLILCVSGISGCRSYVPHGMAGASQGDLQIANDVTSRLEVDTMTANYTFGVTCENGIQGAIPNEVLRTRIISIVKGTPGVQGVVDKLYRYDR